ncbi:hypothetical protein GGF32_008086 [Allomyces javanicus]|nr:hypothetical protein GGF32_008086 [Allomyces javanicus]
MRPSWPPTANAAPPDPFADDNSAQPPPSPARPGWIAFTGGSTPNLVSASSAAQPPPPAPQPRTPNPFAAPHHAAANEEGALRSGPSWPHASSPNLDFRTSRQSDASPPPNSDAPHAPFFAPGTSASGPTRARPAPPPPPPRRRSVSHALALPRAAPPPLPSAPRPGSRGASPARDSVDADPAPHLPSSASVGSVSARRGLFEQQAAAAAAAAASAPPPRPTNPHPRAGPPAVPTSAKPVVPPRGLGSTPGHSRTGSSDSLVSLLASGSASANASHEARGGLANAPVVPPRPSSLSRAAGAAVAAAVLPRSPSAHLHALALADRPELSPRPAPHVVAELLTATNGATTPPTTRGGGGSGPSSPLVGLGLHQAGAPAIPRRPPPLPARPRVSSGTNAASSPAIPTSAGAWTPATPTAWNSPTPPPSNGGTSGPATLQLHVPSDRANRTAPRVPATEDVILTSSKHASAVVRCVATHGDVVVTGHKDATRIHDARTGRLVAHLLHPDLKVSAMAWRPSHVRAEHGTVLWIGFQNGDVWAVDVLGKYRPAPAVRLAAYTSAIAHAPTAQAWGASAPVVLERRKVSARGKRIVHILPYRWQMWVIDEDNVFSVFENPVYSAILPANGQPPSATVADLPLMRAPFAVAPPYLSLDAKTVASFRFSPITPVATTALAAAAPTLVTSGIAATPLATDPTADMPAATGGAPSSTTTAAANPDDADAPSMVTMTWGAIPYLWIAHAKYARVIDVFNPTMHAAHPFVVGAVHVPHGVGNISCLAATPNAEPVLTGSPPTTPPLGMRSPRARSASGATPPRPGALTPPEAGGVGHRRGRSLGTGMLLAGLGDSTGSLETTTPPVPVPAQQQQQQQDWVLTGHDDGKVVVWDVATRTARQVVAASAYRITSLVVPRPSCVWVGLVTGKVLVYQIRASDCAWILVKEFHAADKGKVTRLVPHTRLHQDWAAYARTAAALAPVHQVAAVAAWSDGSVVTLLDADLLDDWVGAQMKRREPLFAEYTDLSVLVCSWNLDASAPRDITAQAPSVLADFGGSRAAPVPLPRPRGASADELPPSPAARAQSMAAAPLARLEDWVGQAKQRTGRAPDVIVVGFQETVNLEDKKKQARTFLTYKKAKTPTATAHEKQHRMWTDAVTDAVRAAHAGAGGGGWPETYTDGRDEYKLVVTQFMVGLALLVYVRVDVASSARLDLVEAHDVKTGMGGYHGNKGALVARLCIDDASLCFVVAHLAAGQDDLSARNKNAHAILDSTRFNKTGDKFVYAADGRYIADHHHVWFLGDLNYRIDTDRARLVAQIDQARLAQGGPGARPLEADPDFLAGLASGTPAAVARAHAAATSRWQDIWAADQLVKMRRSRHPAFALAGFAEGPLAFVPTYKYDTGVNADIWDSSEKQRAPAWCDRILFLSQVAARPASAEAETDENEWWASADSLVETLPVTPPDDPAFQTDSFGFVPVVPDSDRDAANAVLANRGIVCTAYGRMEARISDHRPIFGTYLARGKCEDPGRRAHVRSAVLARARARTLHALWAPAFRGRARHLGFRPEIVERAIARATAEFANVGLGADPDATLDAAWDAMWVEQARAVCVEQGAWTA